MKHERSWGAPAEPAASPATKRLTRRLVIGGAALVVALGVLVAVSGGRSEGGATLAALRADPLATWQPGLAAGWARLGTRAEASKGVRPAYVRSSFAVQAEGDDFFDAAIDAARAAGWSVHDLERRALTPPVERTATARKSGPEGLELRGVIVLASGAGGAEAEPDELTIELSGQAPDR